MVQYLGEQKENQMLREGRWDELKDLDENYAFQIGPGTASW